MPTRRCIVDSEGGPVTVRLMANNLLRAGADFLLEDADGEERESWKMTAGIEGESDEELDPPPGSLAGNVMAWEILVCSPDGRIDHGDVDIQVLQRGVPCVMTKPAHRSLEGVPACETNKAVSIKASLGFLLG